MPVTIVIDNAAWPAFAIFNSFGVLVIGFRTTEHEKAFLDAFQTGRTLTVFSGGVPFYPAWLNGAGPAYQWLEKTCALTRGLKQ